MPEATQVYTTAVSGLWSTRHEVRQDGNRLGVLHLQRRPTGVVAGGRFEPEQGEVFLFRRDPGLLRNQFSMWTDTREWLGSSLRWSFMRREVALHNGGKPFRLLPVPGLGAGWVLYAPKTGETARIALGVLGRHARLEVYRRLEFTLLLFAYFLGYQLLAESLWPGPSPERALQLTERAAL